MFDSRIVLHDLIESVDMSIRNKKSKSATRANFVWGGGEGSSLVVKMQLGRRSRIAVGMVRDESVPQRVVGDDDALRREEAQREDFLEVRDVAGLVCVDEDDVELLACERVDSSGLCVSGVE